MSTDPQQAGVGTPPPAPAPEPTDAGHRARAYAATLLGELTGNRKQGAPNGSAPAPTAAAVPGPARQDAGPSPKAQAGPASVPDLTASTLRADAQVAPTAAPAASASLAVPAASASSTSRANGDVRPAPFTYAEVALHHTGPARARAGAVLDACGPRINASADRDQIRRAARTAGEAAALLDACDALDARAGAVDATWTGERYGATEIREFEGAWSGYYDTAQALSSHA